MIKIIDQVHDIKKWLNGDDINVDSLYRTVLLMSAYFNKNLSEDKDIARGERAIMIKDMIFEWANKFNIKIPFSVSKCVARSLYNNIQVSDGITLNISKKDIDNIMLRFDNKNMQRVALGFLCNAKAFAGEDGVFSVSLKTLGNWIGIRYDNISRNYLKYMETFGYIERIKNSPDKKWNSFGETAKYRTTNKYRILVEHDNFGEYSLKDNNFEELFNEVFSI